uniref:uncharacterized protein LOC122591182 n=1 Tax=Erigeron canadensis TaxID=72917 RepID=UPI001CB9D21F|nr:uncharacterized protein LOC122591182 [Erigeron canadensis]
MASSLCCKFLGGFGFHQNPNLISPSDSCSLNLHSPSLFRFKNATKLLTRRNFPLLRVSNKPSEEPIGKTEAITSGDKSTAQGPPFLTILAGIVVFALVLWVVGTIVSWLIGLLGLIFSK